MRLHSAIFALATLIGLASADAQQVSPNLSMDKAASGRKIYVTDPITFAKAPLWSIDGSGNWWPLLGTRTVTAVTGSGSTVVMADGPSLVNTTRIALSGAGDGLQLINNATSCYAALRTPDSTNLGSIGTWCPGNSTWNGVAARGAWTFDAAPTWTSGQLAVAYGGTGTNTATGTGAVVRNYNPTFGGSPVSSATTDGDAWIALNSTTGAFTTIRHPDSSGKGAIGAWAASAWRGMYGRGAWQFDTAPIFNTPSYAGSASLAATLGIVNARQCYDIRRAGVVWDGVTNDSAKFVDAVNAALAETGNGGACVELPKGTGILCDITLPTFSMGLRIVGAGQGATQVKVCSATANLFSTTNSALNRNFEAAYFTVLPYSTQTAGTYFRIDTTFNVNIHHIDSPGGYNFGKIGDGNGVNNAFVTNTLGRNFKGAVWEFGTGYDLWFYGNGYDSDCGRTDSACQPYGFFVVRNFGGIMLGENDGIHCGTCYRFEPLTSGQEITWVFIANAQADTCAGDGYYFHAIAGTKIKGVHAVKPWASSCAGNGLRFREEASGLIGDVSLVMPIALTNDSNGIYFSNWNQAATIVAPQIGGNSATSTNIASGITFASGAGRAKILGGTVGAQAGLTATQRFGVDAQAGANIAVTITGTNLCGNATGAVNNSMSADKLTATASDCVNPGGVSTVSVGSSPYTYTPTITPQTINLYGGSVSSVTVAGTQVCSASPCSTRASPGQAVVVTFSSAPTMTAAKD